MTAKPHCVAIIQGRMAASRLPGKVLADICGQLMLVRVIERTRRAVVVDEVLAATTTDPTDDPVADFCREQSYPCFRGSQYESSTAITRPHKLRKLISWSGSQQIAH